jgi:hypothetical protein
MATESKKETIPNGTHDIHKPIELAIGLPHSPGTRIHLHLTILATKLILFLTTASIDAGSTASATMGSFVYAMPDVQLSLVSSPKSSHILTPIQRYNPSQPLSTPIYSSPSSLDFATRLAKILVRRTSRLCYVGGSINLSEAACGGTVEEETEAFRAIIDVVTSEVKKAEAS